MRETPQDVRHAQEYLPGEQELCQEHDNDGSTSAERLFNTDPKSSLDDHDPYNVGSQNKEGHEKIKMITFAMEGEEGHN